MGTLYFNGTIYTMMREGETVEAIFAEGKVIRDAGSLQDLSERYGSEIKEKVDLKGGVMFPGFVDSHLHIIGHGEKLIRRDLSHLHLPKKWDRT